MKTTLPPFIECYKQLISIPSISAFNTTLDHSNQDLINLLANWFYDLGFAIDIQTIPNTHNKFNMLAKSREEDIGGLMLSGHTDTVPCDFSQWRYDPFTLTELHGKLYGLGSVDMKGFFAFILDVLRDVNFKKFKKPLYILATADEETTMGGADFFVKNTTLKPDIAIIGEPTSLKPIRAHRGHCANIIRVKGESGHSSEISNKTINAIELMQKVIDSLINLRNIYKQNDTINQFFNPPFIINFGYIKGGDIVNRICSYCELHIDIRPAPECSVDNLDLIIHKTIDSIKKNWPGRIIIEKLHSSIPAYNCPINHILVQQIESLLDKPTKVANYCTEASLIQQLCPTIILGPGSITQAHQPNECMDISYLKPTYKIIKKMIHYFCN
ncbi:MAG: acetylornithine deacetylase [Pantoea sp. Brub]|nr:acetylornithine deacetylase [Pantoea sp. Brub]